MPDGKLEGVAGEQLGRWRECLTGGSWIAKVPPDLEPGKIGEVGKDGLRCDWSMTFRRAEYISVLCQDREPPHAFDRVDCRVEAGDSDDSDEELKAPRDFGWL